MLDARLAEYGLSIRRNVGTSRELRDDTGVLPPGVEADPEGVQPAETEPAGTEPTETEPATQEGSPAPSAGAGDSEEPSFDPGLVEFLEGTVVAVLSTPSALERAKGDVAGLGDEIVPLLAHTLQDAGRDPLELKVHVDLATAVPHADLALALCELTASAEDAWLRRYAAWGLEAHRGAEGADAVIPRLLLRVKYEPDGVAIGWILRTLWGFGNTAGVERARGRARTLRDPAGKASLEQSLAGYAGIEAPTAVEPSEALLAETWHWISDLSGEHFQLRGVDDARFVLSSLGPWAAEVFAEALEDDDAYVRLHVTQVLERMAERGRPAYDSLCAALRDPNGGVRGAAAEALVATAGEAALEPLLARLDEVPRPPYEDRVALARALSLIPGTGAHDRLRADFEGSPGVDLRLAAAAGLLRAADREALAWLIAQLGGQDGDPSGAEAALDDWLQSEAPAIVELLGDGAHRDDWDALGPEGAVIHDARQARDRRAKRAELLASRLAEQASVPR